MIQPNESFEYYQSHIFYTNFDVFARRENSRISGHGDVNWIDHVRANHPFLGSAFVFSCGNGWVERTFFQKGIIRSVAGFDILQKYVSQAEAEAVRIGLPATYSVADSNTFEPRGLRCGVAINSGAMHHVAYINRFTRILSEICEDGIYVGHDYTGAHRNQYGLDVWGRIVRVHASLPPAYRVRLAYPHMPTMLASDPSEAVHSELQWSVLERHFDIAERAALGGAVAHTLLLNNHNLHRDQQTPEGAAALEHILLADEEALQAAEGGSLFTFFVARPKRHRPSPEELRAWQEEEDAREEEARLRGGRYYEPTPLELIYDDFEWRMHAQAAAHAEEVTRLRSALTERVAAFENSTSWRITAPLRRWRTTIGRRAD